MEDKIIFSISKDKFKSFKVTYTGNTFLKILRLFIGLTFYRSQVLLQFMIPKIMVNIFGIINVRQTGNSFPCSLPYLLRRRENKKNRFKTILF